MLKISLIAAAAIIAAAAPAFAQEQADAPQRTVSYADLDLTSPAGIAALDQRLETAVNQVCNRDGVRDLSVWMATQQCRDKARSQLRPTRDALVAAAKAKMTGQSVVLAAK